MKGTCEGCAIGPLYLFAGLCEVCLSTPGPNHEREARIDQAERRHHQRYEHVDALDREGVL